MIGRSDDNRVNLIGFRFDHFPIVRVRSGIFEASFLRCHMLRINVAEGNDVFSGNAIDIGQSSVGGSNTGDDELFIGRPGFGQSGSGPDS